MTGWLAVVLWSLAPSTAAAAEPFETPETHAQKRIAVIAQAEALFDQAKTLMKTGRAIDACPKFEESQKLDPGAGTQFFLAECMQTIGRIARAYALFSDLEGVLIRVDDPRAALARQRAAALRLRVPRLTLRFAPANLAAGVSVRCDGQLVGEAERTRPLDLELGRHVIEARAEGRATWRSNLELHEGDRITLDVPELARSTALASDERGLGVQRTAAVAIGGVGFASLAAGSIILVVAKQHYRDAVGGCRRDANAYACAAGTDAKANGDDAAALANGATVLGGIGIGALAVGAVMWFTDSSQAAQKALTSPWGVSVGATSIVARGTF